MAAEVYWNLIVTLESVEVMADFISSWLEYCCLVPVSSLFSPCASVLK